MRAVFICMVVLIGGGFVFMAIVQLFTPRREPRPRRLLRALCGCFLVYGAIAFFGAALSSLGGLRFLGDSFEWPMGYVGGVATDSAGRYIAPHCPSGRIQVYDRDRKFVRGWFVDASGGIFKLRVIEDDKIEVFTARRQRRFLFAPDGTLLERGSYKPKSYPDLPSGPSSAMVFDTPWILWPFSHPFIAWPLMFAGFAGLIALDRKNKARSTAAKQSPGAEAMDAAAARVPRRQDQA